MSGIALGAIVAAAGLALQLCSTGRSLRTAGFAAYAAGVLSLAGDLLHSPISTIRTDAGRRPALAAAGLLAGLAAIGVAAAIAHRKPTLALMAVVTWQLGRAAVVDVSSGVIAIASAALLATRRVNAAWLVLAGGLVGIAVAALRP